MIMRALSTLAVCLIIIGIWAIWGILGPTTSTAFLEFGADNLPSISVAIEEGQVLDPFGRAGQWGDSFGALNALFAGLAFVGVLAALNIQMHATDRQVKDYHRQRFEATYFELLNLLRDARAEAQFRYSSDYLKSKTPDEIADRDLDSSECGRIAFKRAIFEIVYRFKSMESEAGLDKRALCRVYRGVVHIRFESTWSPYFRIVYTILRRIKDDKVLTAAEKVQFANLLRSQMTSYEASLAGFNALMPEANDFIDLLTEFRMLKYSSPRSKRLLEKVYDEKAFAPRND